MVGCESSKQPPWSIATSTSTDPGFIRDTRSFGTSFGASAPGTRTVPITMSASRTSRWIASELDAIWRTRFPYRQKLIRSLSRSVSSRVTSAPMPSAMLAAFWPAVPAPRMTTFAFATPPTPPMSTPMPPSGFIIECAPTCGARQPATSLIGYSSGSSPLGSWTVSYAIAVVPAPRSASVPSRSAARWRYVNSVRSLRSRWYSLATGSFTLSTISPAAQVASAPSTIVAPCATKSSSLSDEPIPAPDWMKTWWPARTSSLTPTGVIATRNSLFLTSVGTAMRVMCLLSVLGWTTAFDHEPRSGVQGGVH